MSGNPKRGAVIAALSLAAITGTLRVSAQAPALTPARHLCESDGGIFIEGGAAYRCQFSAPTAYKAKAAEALCLQRYGGFSFIGEEDNYLCLLPLAG